VLGINRNTRIVIKSPDRKDQILTRRSRQEVLDLFDGLVMKHGETAYLESYFQDRGQWVEQEVKKLLPKKLLA
jgi:hypothetical protein